MGRCESIAELNAQLQLQREIAGEKSGEFREAHFG
jgi:hypothetical protein